MLQTIIDRTFENPVVFNIAQRALNNNFKATKRFIKQEILPKRKVLDLPCGSGDFCKEFEKEYYTGIDVSKRRLNYAKKKYPSYNFKFMDAQSTNFKNNEFDYIFTRAFYHHLDDKTMENCLKEIKRILKKEGKILIVEDVKPWSFNLLGNLVYKFDTGKFIRTNDQYKKIFRKYFRIERNFLIKDGFCFFTVFILKPHSTRIKTVLINPPLPAEKQAGNLKDIANVLPPLGVGYLAAMLEKEKFDVDIIDCIPLNLNIKELIELLKQKKPDIIALTSTILTIDLCKKISFEIKKNFPNSLLVIGGPQITSLPKETMANSAFEIGIIGEGEVSFLELVKTYKSKPDFSKINGLIIKEGNNYKITPPREYIKNLDDIPKPARHLYPPLEKYKPVPASYKKLPVGLAMSSRGCPYQCIFCDRKVFGNKFRAHSAKRVVDEMEELINVYGAREIRFMDDTFTLDKKRVYDICAELKKRRISVPWTCLTRVDRVDYPLLKTMKEAGCWQVIYGLESGSDEMLKRIKKGFTIEQAKKAVKASKKAGLNVRATFVFGMPGETYKSIKQTVEYAKKLDLDVVTFFTVVLFPGNELYQIVKKEGKILNENFEDYSSMLDDETNLCYLPEGMEEKEYKKAINKAYREFYLRPSFIIKQLLAIRSFRDIHRYWKAFLVVIKIK